MPRPEAARELSVGIYALASSVVLTALVAINVVQRMTPAATNMLGDAIARARVTAQLHAALASARLPEPAPVAARERFDDALAQAARGTSPTAQYLVSELEGLRGPALRGDQHALELTLATLSRLETSNRAAIEAATANFRRLGTNGAWALALLGMIGVAAGGLVQRRLYRRVVAPLNELERVLLSVGSGDELQRCAALGVSSQQRQALRSLNRLIDATGTQASEGPSPEALPRDIVPHLLDALGGSVALVDERGGLLAASQPALEALSRDDAAHLRDGMRRVAQGMTDEKVLRVERGPGWVLVRWLTERSAEPADGVN